MVRTVQGENSPAVPAMHQLKYVAGDRLFSVVKVRTSLELMRCAHLQTLLICAYGMSNRAQLTKLLPARSQPFQGSDRLRSVLLELGLRRNAHRSGVWNLLLDGQ